MCINLFKPVSSEKHLITIPRGKGKNGKFGFRTDDSCRVTIITNNGPAKSHGLELGDIICAINKQNVASRSDIDTYLNLCCPFIQLTIKRTGNN